MANVVIGIGSNVDRVNNITGALRVLNNQFKLGSISSVYESEAVGFVGDNFFNLVAVIETSLELNELIYSLKKIEVQFGRIQQSNKFSPRTLDIDILLCGDFVGEVGGSRIPREEIIENAFVLRPLSEILPESIHPELKTSFSELWLDYKNDQKLWPISFSWNNKNLPCS